MQFKEASEIKIFNTGLSCRMSISLSISSLLTHVLGGLVFIIERRFTYSRLKCCRPDEFKIACLSRVRFSFFTGCTEYGTQLSIVTRVYYNLVLCWSPGGNKCIIFQIKICNCFGAWILIKVNCGVLEINAMRWTHQKLAFRHSFLFEY